VKLYPGRALTARGPFYGIFQVEEEQTLFYPLGKNFELLVAALDESRDPQRLIKTSADEPFTDFKFLPPSQPTKIIAVGLNYRDHAEEFGLSIPDEPLLFLKPPSAAAGHLEPIIYPKQAQRVEYEAELAVIIGRQVKNADSKTAASAIFGYTCGNDVTERYYQKKDGQWTRAKGFDTFAPFGPWIAIDAHPEMGLKIKLYLNDKLKQHSSTVNMIFSPVELVAFVSGIMTLYPGDVIFTGTPSGVGPIAPGDVIKVSIEQIGTLINPVGQA